jgi:hypothetical protein
MTYEPMDSIFAPVGIYGINYPQKAIPLTQYANQVAYDLQNPFPQSSTSRNINSKVPWNPVSYRDVQEPNGSIIGVISQN